DDRRVAALGDGKEMMRRRGRLDCIDGDLHPAVGAVLETHRARQPRSELAMYLALGRARTDRTPGDQVGDVLRSDHVQVLGSCRQLQLVDLEQNPPRQPQALVDAETAVEPRVVDEAFPAYGGARLL